MGNKIVCEGPDPGNIYGICRMGFVKLCIPYINASSCGTSMCFGLT